MAAVVALLAVMQTTVSADDATAFASSEGNTEESTNAKLSGPVDKETSTMARRKRMIEDLSTEDSTVESETMMAEEERELQQNLEQSQFRDLLEAKMAEPLLEDEGFYTPSTIGSERRLEETTPMVRMVHSLENTPALARRLMMKRMSEDYMTSDMPGKLAPGAREDSAMARAAQADPRGLLDGLLGGGGSGGNCTASGGTVSTACTSI